MECPRCLVRLEEISIEELPLNECPSCRGVWFDFTEFERLLGMGRGGLEVLGGSRLDPEKSAPEQGKLYCPRCEGHLVKVRGTLDPEVTLLGCLSCYGRWVDGNEILRLKRTTLLTKLGRVLRKVW